ncbi:MAG: DUF1566 domain-containing protein [Treponema sp.]|nr:DUF1566 domain-containing protein [Treponema sp.]
MIREVIRTVGGIWKQRLPALEFTAQWSVSEEYIRGIINELGSGRENTRIIVEYLNQKRERDCAAQLCQSLDIGGYNDWFLPNFKELNLMYDNLWLNGLGDFHSRWYWSSSSDSSKGGHNTWCKSFSNGNLFLIDRNQIHSVRAIRVF